MPCFTLMNRSDIIMHLVQNVIYHMMNDRWEPGYTEPSLLKKTAINTGLEPPISTG